MKTCVRGERNRPFWSRVTSTVNLQLIRRLTDGIAMEHERAPTEHLDRNHRFLNASGFASVGGEEPSSPWRRHYGCRPSFPPPPPRAPSLPALQPDGALPSAAPPPLGDFSFLHLVHGFPRRVPSTVRMGPSSMHLKPSFSPSIRYCLLQTPWWMICFGLIPRGSWKMIDDRHRFSRSWCSCGGEGILFGLLEYISISRGCLGRCFGISFPSISWVDVVLDLVPNVWFSGILDLGTSTCLHLWWFREHLLRCLCYSAQVAMNFKIQSLNLWSDPQHLAGSCVP